MKYAARIVTLSGPDEGDMQYYHSLVAARAGMKGLPKTGKAKFRLDILDSSNNWVEENRKEGTHGRES